MTNVRNDPESWAGSRFRELRNQRGWSQQDVADRMKAFGYSWSQATMTRLETATRPVRLNEVADLAALHGLKIGDFLAGAPAVAQPSCPACKGRPHPGFTCNTCGRPGP